MTQTNTGPGRNGAWRALFHLHYFIHVSQADRKIERREIVWIRRYLADHGMESLAGRMHDLLESGGCDLEREQLASRAAAEFSTGEKRRFVYNLAQLLQSKGALAPVEYERILDAALNIGVPETEADSIVRSVFSVNDTFMAIVGLLAIGAILYFTQAVIVPLVIAIFITMIINQVESLIARALRLKRFRWLNKIAAMVAILGVLFALVVSATVSGREIARALPAYEDRITLALESSPATQNAIDWLRTNGVLDRLQKLPIGRTISGFLGSLMSLLGNFLLVGIFTGFLVFGSASFTGLLQEMNEKISAYISVKTMVSFLTAIGAFLLCWAFGIDFPLFWATLAFLLNYIPSVGSIAATVPPIILSMIQLEWAGVIAFAIVFTVLQIFLGQVLEPKLMGTRLSLNPIAILLGLIFWGFLWGIPGMFLATPLMALLRILASYFNFSRGFERLLSADPG